MLMWLLAVVLALTPQASKGAEASRAGWEALARKDAESAAASFRTALEANPKDARALTGAGLAAQLLGRPAEAREDYLRAIQNDPRLLDAYELIGRLEYEQGNLAKAIEWYEQLGSLDHGNARVN